MNVLYIIGGLNTGGKEVLLLDILSQNHLPYNAFCIYRKDGNLSYLFQNSVAQITKIQSHNIISYIEHLHRFLLYHKIDIIHAQSSFDAMLAKTAAIGLNIRIIQTIHGINLNGHGLSVFLQKFAILLSDKTVFVSNYQKQCYLDNYKIPLRIQNNLRVIHNGIDLRKFDNATKCDTLSLSGTGKVKMAMVGSFSEGRDQITVCKFLKILNSNDISFDFYFIGRKNDSEPEVYDQCYEYCLKSGIQESVHFLGNRNDVLNILKGMDAFIYCTNHDSFGIAVVEAMISGVPVFVNDWPALKEVSHDGKFATIFKSRDSYDLFRVVNIFLSDIDTYKKRAQEQSIAIKKLYSIERHIDNINRLYIETISE